MARLRCSVEVPGIEAERLIAALPILVERCRGVGFADDGVAVVDGVPHQEVRLVGGVAGQEGAAYEIAGYVDGAENAPLTTELGSPDPIRMTVTTDRIDLLRAGFSGNDPDGTPSDGWAELEQPDEPRSVSFGVAVGMPPGTPEIFGRSLQIQGRSRLSDLWQQPGPQVDFSAGSAKLTAVGSVRVERTTDQTWQVDVQIRLHPSGYLVIAAVAWPFLKRRAEESLAGWIRDTMADTAARLQKEFGPADGPQQVADRVWAAMTDPVTMPPGEVMPGEAMPGDVTPGDSQGEDGS